MPKTTEELIMEIEATRNSQEITSEFINKFYEILSKKDYKDLNKDEQMEWKIPRTEVYKKFAQWLTDNDRLYEKITKGVFYFEMDRMNIVNSRYCIILKKNN